MMIFFAVGKLLLVIIDSGPIARGGGGKLVMKIYLTLKIVLP
jgi:hypothetical protein